MKYSSEVPDSTPAVLGTRSTSQSYRKLLASHLSIYNALNDPELNQGVQNDTEQESHGSKSLKVLPIPGYDIHFPEAKLPSRVPTPELQFSWQLLSNESVYRDARVLKKPSSSILSSTTDDKDESMVVVSRNGGSPSFGGVMVFETDEEDPLDGEPEILPNQKSFVMPKMRLSEQQILDIVVLSNSHAAECEALVDRIKNDLVSTKMSITNLPVSGVGDSADLSLALRQADLVFMINDGSPLFIKCLETVFDQPDSISAPKLTVINMMSVNYFINLFDLIAFMRPFQIWKTSSLHQQNLVTRIEDYILLESLMDSLECQGTPGIDSIMDLSVTRTAAPNYKQIERQIRHELQDSVSLSSSDPLRLSSSFYHVNILYTIIKKMFHTHNNSSNPHDSGDSKLWLFCSFALGIGLGVTLAGSAATVFGFCVSNAITQVDEKPEIKGLLAHPVRAVDFVDEWVQEIVDSQFCCTITRWWDNFSGSMQLFSSHMVEAVKGGFEKVVCMAQMG